MAQRMVHAAVKIYDKRQEKEIVIPCHRHCDAFVILKEFGYAIKDYQVLAQNGENLDSFTQRCGKPQGGRPTNIYMLSVPCLEFFIARKVRPVFEVYRQVFHTAANGELPLRMPNCIPGNTEGTLAPLAQFHANIMERYARVVDDSKGQ